MKTNVRSADVRAGLRSAERHSKQSHKLPPEVCALYVPDVRGYISKFSASGFRVVALIELADRFVDDDATNAARRFLEMTGLRVVVRSAHAPASVQDAPMNGFAYAFHRVGTA